MDETQNDFSPLLIDQQIDDPTVLLSPESAQLVQEVRAMFEQELSEGIERGWNRLQSQRTSQQPEVLDFSAYRQRRERTSAMHDNTLSSTPPQTFPKKRVSRLFSLVAAALVCTLLVGSLALVLTLTKRGPATVVGTRGSATSTPSPTPTATPLVIPPSCKDAQDHADEVLCAQGEETLLNITRQFSITLHNPNGSANGTGIINVTFLRAYADPTRLLLAYTINQAPDLALGNDWGGFTDLATAQGDISSGGSTLAKGFFAQSFDTSSLPADTTQIQVQAIHTAFGRSLPLSFTLPFHAASKTINVGQSFTQNGYTLTLDRIVLTGSATTIMETTTWSGKKGAGGKIISITINGKDQNFKENAGTGGGNRTEASSSIYSYQSLLGYTGVWKVKMALMQTTSLSSFGPVDITLFTVTFTFTV